MRLLRSSLALLSGGVLFPGVLMGVMQVLSKYGSGWGNELFWGSCAYGGVLAALVAWRLKSAHALTLVSLGVGGALLVLVSRIAWLVFTDSA